jgi:hypothetical protein
MSLPQTTNLGLYLPQAGTTPGSTSDSTPNTYPWAFNQNLNIIDASCYSLNNPVPTAGIDINANLTLNGYSLTSVGGITSTGTITTTGTLSGPTVQFNTANSYTSAGTMTLAPNVASGGTGVLINNTVSMSSGYLLAIENDGTLAFQVDQAGDVGLTGNISQITAATALKLLGGTTAGVTLGSTSSQTSGQLLQVQNDGATDFSVAFNGHINPSTSGTLGPGGSPSASTSSPNVTAWNTNPPANILVYGSDSSFVVWVQENASHTHTFTAVTAFTMFYVKFANAYANNGFTVFGQFVGSAGTGSTPDITADGTYGVLGGTILISLVKSSVNGDGFQAAFYAPSTNVTTESTWYGFAFQTACAGAAS